MEEEITVHQWQTVLVHMENKKSTSASSNSLTSTDANSKKNGKEALKNIHRVTRKEPEKMKIKMQSIY